MPHNNHNDPGMLDPTEQGFEGNKPKSSLCPHCGARPGYCDCSDHEQVAAGEPMHDHVDSPYVTESAKLVQKWAATGLLKNVPADNLAFVAERLELAANKAMLEDRQEVFEEEINYMREEGLFNSPIVEGFDKFMDATLVKESRQVKKEVITDNRRHAQIHRHHPGERTRYKGGR